MLIYMDFSTGASGDKICGALLELAEALGLAGFKELEAIAGQLVPGARIERQRVMSGGIAASSLLVYEDAPPHRHWAQIRELISAAPTHGILSQAAANLALEVFERIAEAEAAVHGVPVERVHFHEVGAADSIIDACCASYLLEALAAEAVYATPLALGSGTVVCSHGELDVPAPATARLTSGLPTVAGSFSCELTTPTGAALAGSFVEHWLDEDAVLPPLREAYAELACGFGAGTRSLGDTPNVVLASAFGRPDAEAAVLAQLQQYASVAVAFSGGADSTLLLDLAHEAFGDNCVAITALSASFPERESAQARAFCAERGIRHLEVLSEELGIEGFADNPPDRCYLCKRELFGKMLGVAAELGIEAVAEGSNLDDEGDYRPGLKAIAELGIASPLRQAGLCKADVRDAARRRGLAAWSKPSFACLASRIPYGASITPELLERIGKAEQFLLDAGIRQVRVRAHGDVARIEADAEGMDALADPKLRAETDARLKALGFSFVAMDLAGYRTGSMNLTLPEE